MSGVSVHKMHIHPFDIPREVVEMESSVPGVDGASGSGGTSSSTLSFVLKAKTALHSAAVRAEKVLTDIKADLKSERDGDGQAKKDGRRMEVREPAGADVLNRSKEETSEAFSVAVQGGDKSFNKLTIPPASVFRHLAVAYENVKNFCCTKDLLTLVEDPLTTKEKSGLSFSAVKSLVLREKDDKSSSDFCNDDKVRSMMQLLFDSEKSYAQWSSGSDLASSTMRFVPKDIRGAPPESFIVKLSEIIGGFRSLQKMASFWCCVTAELRRLWSEGSPVPWMPLDAKPDLDSCLLHQQLQVINCCIARRYRRIAAIESLESAKKEGSLDNSSSLGSPENSNYMSYARLVSGEYILRLGADCVTENLTMLETGEPVYSPITQEGPILTEELIKETEELVLRTGSFGGGCSQLLSDMQAFKAANPGCVLEDFIRWHSPPDWTEMESTNEANDHTDLEGSSRRGRLSKRMQKEGNLWRELWESAKALPAVKQIPLFDEDLAVENIFSTLEEMPPPQLFKQLFLSMLSSTLAIAEAAISTDSNLSKLFYECKDWVTYACLSEITSKNIGDICKVYETIETIILHPEEAITIMDQQHGEAATEEPKNHFRRINLNFVRKDINLLRKKPPKDDKKSEDKHMHVFSHLFDKKSLFSKKATKAETSFNF
ncbi:hypothetical protein HPP92_012415 [Vanilla planifolia]|uniref:Rab3GAP catalytic subunit conserved domain-containing protein n=1 Tax=Vanilla planifolia TaxID=51239 RepID=A0A835R8X6_VANPL|nr:hypothetical protein HPP92_012415 [Vanilla planifolia]